MIRITVDLISAKTGETTKLGEMHICNTGKSAYKDPECHDYEGRILRKPDFQSVTRKGRVVKHRRKSYVIWVLVSRMLRDMGY